MGVGVRRGLNCQAYVRPRHTRRDACKNARRDNHVSLVLVNLSLRVHYSDLPVPDLELLLVDARLFFEGFGETPGLADASLTLKRSMSRARAPAPAAPLW